MDSQTQGTNQWLLVERRKRGGVLRGQGLSMHAQSCPSLCDPMDCSLPGSPVHGILQARTLEWVAIFFSKGIKRFKLFHIKLATRICYTTQGIQLIFYITCKWGITFKNCESLQCIPTTYIQLYINYTSIKKIKVGLKGHKLGEKPGVLETVCLFPRKTVEHQLV